MRVGAVDAPPVDEDGGRAADLEFLSVRDTGIDFGGGLRAAHARFEGIGIEAGAASVVKHLVPGIRSRNDVLIVINKVVELPEGFGVLLIGAAAGNRGATGPRVKGFQGKVLEDDFDLRVLGEESAEDVVEAAADRALEVRILDDRDGCFRIAKDGSIREFELGDILGKGIRGEVVQFAAEEIATVLGQVHFDGVGAFRRFDVDGNLGETGIADLFGGAYGDLDIRAECEVVTQKSLDVLLSFSGHGLLGRGTGSRECDKCKQAKSECCFHASPQMSGAWFHGINR